MADAKETMRYLTTKYDIAPAGTREEIDAAESLARVFHEHGLETAQKSFNYTWSSDLGLAVVMMVLAFASILGVLLAGIPAILMLVIGLAMGVLYLLDKFGIKTYGLLTMSGSSQNVVARHPAAAPAANGQKARPVVVVAHYDTPRSDLLSKPAVAWIKPYIPRALDILAIIDVVALIVQVLPLSVGFRSFFAALAVIGSVSLMLWGISVILQLFVLPYTLGANDNKSGVAAVLGVLDRVRPMNGGTPFGPDDEIADGIAEGFADADADDSHIVMRPRRPIDRREDEAAVKGIRYGADVIRGLGMLPEDCVVEYVPVEITREHLASKPTDAEAAAIAGNTVLFAPAGEAPAPAPEPEPVLDPEALKDAEADAMFASIVSENSLSGEPAPAGATTLLNPLDIPEVGEPAAPASSLDASQQFIMNEPNSFAAAAIQNPMWGTSSFSPVSANQRFLGDLPDPAVAAVDPFGVSNIQTVGNYNPEDFSAMDFETGTHQAVTPAMLENANRQNLAGFTNDLRDTPKRGRKAKKNRQGRISTRAANMQQQMEEQSFNDWLGLDEGFDAKTSGQQIGSWDNFTQDDGSQTYGNPGAPRWQGGAAPRRNRRSSVQGEEAVKARRAAMKMGDRELVSHEIWFVLTGAGEAGHAGMRDFIKSYHGELRGAYFVNLECIGQGRQSLVVEEAAGKTTVKADRRLVNLFGEASQAINRPLALERMGWRGSEASVALENGIRAVSICGVDDGVPANSRWTGDSPEKLDTVAIDDAVDMVVEVIKNA